MRTPTRSTRVTIRTVAEDAGVSVAAVSKVLREAYGVSDHLRAKVQASIARLNYRPHAAARGMRGQTYTLGVLLPDLHNPFFSEIMGGIDGVLSPTQYHPLIGVGQSRTSVELALVDAMVDRQMDGLVLIGARMSSEEVRAVAERIPTVVIGHHEPDARAFDSVNNDDVRGGELVVGHLAAQGYRNIGFLSLEMSLPDALTVTGQRETGYRRAMDAHGLGAFAQVVRAGQSPAQVRAAARMLLTGPSRAEAIFCWTDFIAIEVISLAAEWGLSIPRDLAVVGYDNTGACDLRQNSLTSIDQSGALLGAEAARLLISRIRGRTQSEHFLVPPRLAIRASSGRRPA